MSRRAGIASAGQFPAYPQLHIAQCGVGPRLYHSQLDEDWVEKVGQRSDGLVEEGREPADEGEGLGSVSSDAAFPGLEEPKVRPRDEPAKLRVEKREACMISVPTEEVRMVLRIMLT